MSETISAFAFQTGKQIEDIIDIRTRFLNKQNQDLQAKIFVYRRLLSEEEKSTFDAIFGITTVKSGLVDNGEGEE